jgi:hypothetical protein
MADAWQTLLDVAIQNEGDKTVGLIELANKAHPELTILPARVIPGFNYYTTVRTGLPAGEFVNAGDGSDSGKSTFANTLVECYPYINNLTLPVTIAQVSMDLPGMQTREEVGGVEDAFQRWGKAAFYGSNATFGTTKAFPGMLDAYDSTNRMHTAGSATSGSYSSVWFVKMGGMQDIKLIAGGNTIFGFGAWRLERITGTNSKSLDAYVNSMNAWIGLQCANKDAMIRLKKIGADGDTGHTLTDDFLAATLAKAAPGTMNFGGTNPEWACFMTLRSLSQLRDSRTATNPTGAPAPWPTEAFGIPIYVTESISNVETDAIS